MDKKIPEKHEHNERNNLLALMLEVQEVYGYLPEKDVRAIAEYVNLPISSIYSLAGFYDQFRLKPPGKNVIRVCRGVSCHVKKSSNILTGLETELGIKAGQTTRDKVFTLETVDCIGACSIAPVININEDYYGRATNKEIPKILAKYKKAKHFKTEIQHTADNV